MISVILNHSIIPTFLSYSFIPFLCWQIKLSTVNPDLTFQPHLPRSSVCSVFLVVWTIPSALHPPVFLCLSFLQSKMTKCSISTCWNLFFFYFLGHRLQTTSLFPFHPKVIHSISLPCLPMIIYTTYIVLTKYFLWKEYLKVVFVWIAFYYL